MSRFLKRWYSFAAAAALCATVAAYLMWRPLQRKIPVLRAGFRNNSLSPTLNPEGRVDALAVEVLAEAARRAHMQLKWVDCPEGPDRALRSGKVDLWPMMTVSPARKEYVHITDPWLAGDRCLVTKGAPPGRWNGLRVAYGFGTDQQVREIAPGATPMHTEGDVAAVAAICAGRASAAYTFTQSLGAFVL